MSEDDVVGLALRIRVRPGLGGPPSVDDPRGRGGMTDGIGGLPRWRTAADRGLDLSDRGMLEAAENAFIEALRCVQFEGSSRDIAACLYNLGAVCRRRGKLRDAEAAYRYALDYYGQADGAEREHAECLQNLANVYAAAGLSERAEMVLRDR